MASKSGNPRHKVISCAECRRLKLKCDRQFPCGNCVKRGLTALCPEGSLPTRPKLLMEEAERLTRQNSELTERMRLLEEALEQLQNQKSSTAHPLLVKRDEEALDGAIGTAADKAVEDINDTLGTLAIDQNGRSFFLGNTAGMESIFRAQETSHHEKPSVPAPNLLHSLGIFSSLHDSKDAVLGQIEVYLPQAPLAHQLIDVYYENGAWLYNPITRDQLFEQVFKYIYGESASEGSFAKVSAHNAALIFMIFALGSFLSHEIDDDAGEIYHQLARTALSCDAILVNPTMESIRALTLMGYYHLLRDHNAAQHVWALMGLAAHMAENIGLHRDGRQWKMEDSVVQERRTLFWEIYYLCTLQSISLGRPPSLSLDYCDCEYPRPEERINHRAGEFKPGFHSRKYQFTSECLSQVVRATLGVRGVAYSTILALDRKIRDHQVLKIPANGAGGVNELGAATIPLTLQRFMLKAQGEMTLLYLHRRYFARAVINYPNDILHSPFGPSVVAIFRSASTYVSLLSELCSLQPELPTRFVIFWNNLLASAFIMASIATRCPTSVLAASALTELDACYSLFEATAKYGRSTRAARALDIVSKTRDRAHKITADVEAGISPKKLGRRGIDTKNEEIDELTILAGRARVVATKTHTMSDSSPITSTKKAAPPTLSPEPNYEAYKAAHPAILQHLREATKTPQILQGFGPESGTNLTTKQQSEGSPGLLGTQPSSNNMLFNVPPELDPTIGLAPKRQQAQQTQQQLQGEGFDDDMNIFAPPLWDTPPSSNGNPEEIVPVGGGMGTDEEWGMYMKQFGMQIDPEGSN